MGKEKIATYFQQIQAKDQHLFVPYIVAGDGKGRVDNIPELVMVLQDCGAAAMEFGIPFCEPVADGTTGQRGGLRALKNGTTVKKAFDVLVGGKETRDNPSVLMAYI